MKTIRSFLAINLSLETARAISEKMPSIMDRCEDAGLRVRWVPPQNMHVTLHFLGNITEPMVRAVAYNIEAVTRSFAPFEMAAQGLGVFPSPEKPKVLWIGVDSQDDALTRLHKAVSQVLDDTGFKTDDKPYSPHVTIGRINEGSGEAVTKVLEEPEEGAFSFGTSTPKELVCYRSDLHKKGADYHLLWRLPLLGKAARHSAPPPERPRSEDTQTDDREPAAPEATDKE